MTKTFCIRIVCFVLAVSCFRPGFAEELRPWVGTNGKVILAELAGFDGELVTLKHRSGLEINAAISAFSSEDRDFIRYGYDPRFASEQLMRSSFEDGTIPPNRFWDWVPGNSGTIVNEQGVIRIACKEKNGRADPRLVFRAFNLKQGKKYTAALEMRSNSSARIRVDVRYQESGHEANLETTLQLENEWKTYRMTYESKRTGPAVLDLSLLSENSDCELRKISHIDHDAAADPAIRPPSSMGGTPFDSPVRIRVSMELKENGKGRLRIAKVAEFQNERFAGKTIATTGTSAMDFKTRVDGVSRLIFDFKYPLPKDLDVIAEGCRVDTASGKLIFQPDENMKNPTCRFSPASDFLQLPATITIDATIHYRGECCNMEISFPHYTVVCQLYSTGRGFEDDLFVVCRCDERIDGEDGRHKGHNLLRRRGFVLQKPFDVEFDIPPLVKNEKEPFRVVIGRNLGLGAWLMEPTRTPLEIDHLSFEGRIQLPKNITQTD